MNRKWWKWFIVLLLVVVGGMIWFAIPSEETYGEGYSEERRRQWNERAEAMYMAYMGYIPPENIDPSIRWRWDDEALSFVVGTMEGSYLPGHEPEEGEEINEEKKQQEETLLKTFPQESLFTIPGKTDLSLIPESGWTEEELAKAGKLHLAERPFMLDDIVRKGREVDVGVSREMMLGLYTAKGGKESDFLLNIWLDKKRDLEIAAEWRIARVYHYGNYQEGREESIRNTPGFEDFLKEVDKGNYEMYDLFKLLIGDKFIPSLESRLRPVLRKRAESGDVVAQRQLGKCMVGALYGYLSIMNGVNSQYPGIKSWRSRILSVLPSEVLDWLGIQEEEPGYKDYKGRWRDLPIYHDYETGLSWCQKAAEQGDMEAKFLWVSGANYMPRFYSREEWERSLEYTRELLEKGYAPMLLAVVMRRDLPFHFYYPREHRQSIMDAAWKSLMERGCYYLLVMDAGPDGDNAITMENINSSENMDRIRRICRIFPTGVMRFYPERMMNRPVFMREFFPYMEQSAELWNMEAIDQLKRFYEGGYVLEKDEAKAEKYREKLEKSANMGNYPF